MIDLGVYYISTFDAFYLVYYQITEMSCAHALCSCLVSMRRAYSLCPFIVPISHFVMSGMYLHVLSIHCTHALCLYFVPRLCAHVMYPYLVTIPFTYALCSCFVPIPSDHILYLCLVSMHSMSNAFCSHSVPMTTSHAWKQTIGTVHGAQGIRN